MQRETDLTPDAFDHAAKAALRDAPLPAPPAWMDAQITAVAHDQARVAASKNADQKVRGVRAPWLKFALPTLAVATLLVAIWLPQTEVNQEGITLPDAARVAAPTPPPAPAPAAAPQPAASEQAATVAPSAATGSAAAAPTSKPTPKLAQPSTAKPATPKPTAAAREAVPAAAAKEQPSPQRAEVARDAIQLATGRPAPPPAAPAPAATVFTEEKAVQDQAQTGTERTADAKAAPSVLAAASQTGRAQASVMSASPSDQTTQAPQLRASTAMNRARPVPVAPGTQAELESIRVLLREGKRDEATKRLLALKEREPQLEIPVDLRDLFPRP
ncbi:MAG: hypothetical protein ACRCV9_09870 [Burkholderiaceae bacterium]